jgi:hypothetical protein
MTTYKIDLLGEYGVNATFNVTDLTLFHTGFDSKLNPFEERGDDVDQPTNTKDPLQVLSGPITWSKAKALNGLIVQVSAKTELWDPLEH